MKLDKLSSCRLHPLLMVAAMIAALGLSACATSKTAEYVDPKTGPQYVCYRQAAFCKNLFERAATLCGAIHRRTSSTSRYDSSTGTIRQYPSASGHDTYSCAWPHHSYTASEDLAPAPVGATEHVGPPADVMPSRPGEVRYLRDSLAIWGVVLRLHS